MRALFAVYEWRRSGGLESVTVDTARALVRAGVELDVWSVHGSGTLEVGGIRAKGLAPPIGSFVYARRWRKILARRFARVAGSYDVLIAGHPHILPVLQEAVAKAGGRTHTWSWVYGLDVWGSAGAALAPSLGAATRVISISNFTAREVATWVKPGSIRIVPPGVDSDRFTPGATADVNRDEILMVGRMAANERYKGHAVLIEAIPSVETRLGRPVRLTIVGGGDDALRVAALARASIATNRIDLKGRVSDEELLSAFRRCAVFAMPSRVERRERTAWAGEGFGLVYVEAQACGRPVVASTDGGAPETLVEGETGLLADPRDSEEVAEKIAELMRDPDRADAMGAAGRRLVEREFSLDRYDERVAALMAEVDAEKAGRDERDTPPAGSGKPAA